MTIKLKNGKVLDPSGGVFGIDDNGGVYEGYDDAPGSPGNEVAGLTPDECRELAQVMMDRWAKWAGAPRHVWVVEEGDAEGVWGSVGVFESEEQAIAYARSGKILGPSVRRIALNSTEHTAEPIEFRQKR